MTKDTLLAAGADDTQAHSVSRSVDALTAPNLVGSTWSINSKGFAGGLEIISMRRDGKFEGTLFSNHAYRYSLISGTWNKPLHQITFTRHLSGGAIQTYKGSLVTDPDTQRPALVGTFTQSNALTRPQPQFQWSAQFQGVVM